MAFLAIANFLKVTHLLIFNLWPTLHSTAFSLSIVGLIWSQSQLPYFEAASFPKLTHFLLLNPWPLLHLAFSLSLKSVFSFCCAGLPCNHQRLHFEGTIFLKVRLLSILDLWPPLKSITFSLSIVGLLGSQYSYFASLAFLVIVNFLFLKQQPFSKSLNFSFEPATGIRFYLKNHCPLV